VGFVELSGANKYLKILRKQKKWNKVGGTVKQLKATTILLVSPPPSIGFK
jgi:hypothetical protein